MSTKGVISIIREAATPTQTTDDTFDFGDDVMVNPANPNVDAMGDPCREAAGGVVPGEDVACQNNLMPVDVLGTRLGSYEGHDGPFN